MMSTIPTATTGGARTHARAQARDAPELPEGVLWDDVVEPGGYAARVVPRGSVTSLVDVDGDACANVLVFNAARLHERLNVADTVKVQWQAYLGDGSLLLSDMGRVLMSVVGDDCGTHDALCGSSTERRNVVKYGHGGVHGPCPNARDRFAVALAKYGLGRRDIPPSVGFFKGVRVDELGGLRYEGTTSFPGAEVALRAEMQVLFVVANTPHVLDPRSDYVVTPLGLRTVIGEPTRSTDALWRATPEGERAFRNTADFVAEVSP
jgi:urea carboxylase-associated protein 2